MQEENKIDEEVQSSTNTSPLNPAPLQKPLTIKEDHANTPTGFLQTNSIPTQLSKETLFSFSKKESKIDNSDNLSDTSIAEILSNFEENEVYLKLLDQKEKKGDKIESLTHRVKNGKISVEITWQRREKSDFRPQNIVAESRII